MKSISQVACNSNFSIKTAFVVPLLAFLMGLSFDASALVVQTWDGEGTPAFVNTTAPADDPGWHNTSSNRSTVYLGNQWVLTAGHAGFGNVVLPSGTYNYIPGTRVYLSNPGSFAGITPTSSSDLLMYRIGVHPTSGLPPELEDPNVKDISITTSAAPFNSELLMIGAGQVRTLNTGTGSFNGQTDYGTNNWGFGKQGTASTVKTWGTNKISSTSVVSGIRKSGLNVLIEFSSKPPDDVIGQLVRFDREFNNLGNPQSGSTHDEAMATGGDSGGPVFFKDTNDDWQLLGLMHGIYSSDPSLATARFGDVTGVSDLSHYKSQIDVLLASDEYSAIGDLDLDGSVTGEIVNGVATGDLADMVANWGYTQASGDVISWTKGDLNQDGTTNLYDFVMLRDALGGSVSVTEFAALVAVAVPEPSSAFLALAMCGGFFAHRRRK